MLRRVMCLWELRMAIRLSLIFVLGVTLWLAWFQFGMATDPRRDLEEKLRTILLKYSPDKAIKSNADHFRASHFTIRFFNENLNYFDRSYRSGDHESLMDRDFLLNISYNKWRYEVDYSIPLILNGTDGTGTYLSVRRSAEGRGYTWIRFLYGPEFDPELKEAILQALREAFPGQPEIQMRPTSPDDETWRGPVGTF